MTSTLTIPKEVLAAQKNMTMRAIQLVKVCQKASQSPLQKIQEEARREQASLRKEVHKALLTEENTD